MQRDDGCGAGCGNAATGEQLQEVADVLATEVARVEEHRRIQVASIERRKAEARQRVTTEAKTATLVPYIPQEDPKLRRTPRRRGPELRCMPEFRKTRITGDGYTDVLAFLRLNPGWHRTPVLSKAMPEHSVSKIRGVLRRLLLDGKVFRVLRQMGKPKFSAALHPKKKRKRVRRNDAAK